MGAEGEKEQAGERQSTEKIKWGCGTRSLHQIQQQSVKGTFAGRGHLDFLLSLGPSCQAKELGLDLLNCRFGKGIQPVSKGHIILARG